MKTKIAIVSTVFFLTLIWCGICLAMDPGGFVPSWQDVFDECPENRCGSPPSGGDGGGGGGPLIVAYTWGPTFSVQEDKDADGWNDQDDNCVFDPNDPSENADGDRYGDACDNCPNIPNDDQANVDDDDMGDVCDPDMDNDGIANAADSCPYFYNPEQLTGDDDPDNDQLGNHCDPDRDGDGIPNSEDNCPDVANPDQEEADVLMTGHGSPPGTACEDANRDYDIYNDNGQDQCLRLYAKSNRDSDGDGIVDACDNCPQVANNDANDRQRDSDRDGKGDACD